MFQTTEMVEIYKKLITMNRYIFLMFFAFTAIYSCTKEQPIISDQLNVTFELNSPGSDSKATVNDLVTGWSQGDKIGFFTNQNSNKSFSTNNSGKKAAFNGTITDFTNSSYYFFVYPYKNSKSLDANYYLTLTLPSYVDQPGNTNKSQLDTLLTMVGRSNSKVTGQVLASSIDQSENGGSNFYILSTKIDFIITNNTGAPITISQAYMTTANNDLVFSTEAKIKLNYDAVDLANYPDNTGDFVLSTPTNPSISVRNISPDAIASGKVDTLSTMIFPNTIPAGTVFYVDVTTNNGTYRVTKNFAATSAFTFSRGLRYKIQVSLDNTTASAGSNIYPGTPYPAVTLAGATYAPVNSGYIAITRPYGLLYQWHRKYGQDKTGISIVAGGSIALATGSLYENRNIFYSSATNKDWVNSNENQSTWSMTTQYNPCPQGWQVPTQAQMNALISLGSSTTQNGLDGQPGIWIGGDYAGTHAGSLFLPNGASRGSDGGLNNASNKGLYWTTTGITTSNGTNAQGFDTSTKNFLQRSKSEGFEIRCVKIVN